MKPRTPGFEEYLAGAFFGYTLATLPLQVIILILQLSSINPEALDVTTLTLLFIGPNLFGGAMSGYLVARRSDTEHWKVGLKNGIGCLILSGLITGLLTGQPESLLALAGKFVGSSISGYLYGRVYQARALQSQK